MTARDLPMLHQWFDAAHARRWCGSGRSLDDVSAQYRAYIDGTVPVYAFVVSANGRSVGLACWARLKDLDDRARVDEVDVVSTAGAAVLIGDPDAVGRGLGPLIIESFLNQFVFADPQVSACVVDPEPDNSIAIRAYEKVGFRFVRAIPGQSGARAVYLMLLQRDQRANAPADEFYIRPGHESELGVAVDIDDDACTLFVEHDPRFDISLPDDHPFVVAERSRWADAACRGRLLFACAPSSEPVGFAALGYVDGQPYLEQLSVRRAWAQRRIGRGLFERARRWSVTGGQLWLTTYASVPWNAPWYERLGFTRTDAAICGPELLARFEHERVALPDVDQRVAMVYRHEAE